MPRTPGNRTHLVRLPDDVIRYIIEYLSSSPKDLARCTLVSRSWRQFSQPLLFGLVTFDAAPPYTSLFQLLCNPSLGERSLPSFIFADPSRGALFKHLKYIVPSRMADDMYAVLAYCTRLQSFTLACDLAPAFLHRIPLRTFPLLKKLTLTLIGTFDEIAHCLQLISDSGVPLEELSLSLKSGHYIEDTHDNPKAPLCIPTLRMFSLYNDHKTFTFLLQYLRPILLNLHRLVVNTVQFHLPAIVELIDANEATLKALDVSEVFDLSSERIPRLLQNGLLQDIVFRLPIFCQQLENFLSALGTIFLDINWSSSSVRFICFRISSPYLLTDLGQHSVLWSRLVEALCKHPGLEMVTLLLEIGYSIEGHYDDDSMCVTRLDLEVHPAFKPLRATGRFAAAISFGP